MDAKQATEMAVSYFEALGSSGPIGFAVESVENDGGKWNVICTMWDYLGARSRSRYKVEVDEAKGSVTSVKKLD